MNAIKNYTKIFYKKISLPAKKLFFSNFSILITSNIILLIIFANLLLFTSCEDEIIQPPPKPPGYQEDIPWPSLANSPWPMYRADPQNTGRSDFDASMITNNITIVDSIIVAGGAVIDENLNCYFISSGIRAGLVKINKYNIDTLLYSSTEIGGVFLGTPLIGKNNEIYFINSFTRELTSIAANGIIRWKTIISNFYGSHLNIDKEGIIYLLTNNREIVAVNSSTGEIAWTFSDNNFGTDGLSISPDGGHLYIPAISTGGFHSFNINTKSIEWSFGVNRRFTLPIVDAYGNIYMITSVHNNGHTSHGLFSIDSEGNENWRFEFGKEQNEYYTPTIDKNGNIYFGGDTLFSVDFEGKLNWAKSLEATISSDLICDVNNLVLFCTHNHLNDEVYLRVINSNGNRLNDIFLYDGTPPPFLNPIISTENKVYAPAFTNQNFYIIK